MAIPKNLIIVVGRQFGSGGRDIGRALAQKYSLEYYDRELLAQAAGQFGYSPHIFAKRDEKRPSALRALMTNLFGVGDSYAQNPMSSESIYNAQCQAIRELAGRSGCVFVGRTADYVLRENPNLVSIFLSSPIERRVKAILKRGDAPTADKAAELANRRDNERENFYNYYTGRRWGHASNYHLAMDASMLDTEAAVNVISRFIEEKFK